MLERISRAIAYVLFDVSLKAILLAALALLATCAFRAMPVHTRHRVWTIVLLAILALPVLTSVVPAWSVPLGRWMPGGDGATNHSARTGSGLAAPSDPIVVSLDRSSDPRQHDLLKVTPRGASSSRASKRARTSAIPVIENDRLAAPTRPHSRLPQASLSVTVSAIWLMGVAVMVLRLLCALLRTSRIRRSSHLVRDRSLPAGVVVRESKSVGSPAVVCWWRPCILLPRSWRAWSDAKRAAVLSHELAHLRRRDPQLSLLTEIATVLYWFHPVSWWIKRQLSRLAELACDEAAAISIGDRLAYARFLVEIAAANRPNFRSRLGATMARSTDVGNRVQRLLDLSEPLTARASWPSLATIALVATAACVLLAAIRLTPARANEKQTTARSGALRIDNSPAKVPAELEKAAEAVTEKQATVADGPVLTLRGAVFLPDGSVAKDAILERSPDDGSGDLLSAQMTEGHFAIKTTGTSDEPTTVLIRTSDSNFQAFLQVEARALRSECSIAARVTLAPARVIQVKVNDGKRSVANAHVQVDASSSYKYRATTRSDGLALLKIARDTNISQICAWSDDHRIGGLPLAPEPTTNGDVAEFVVEISRGEPVRALAVDQQQRGVPNVPLMLTATTGGRHGLYVGENPTSRQTTNAKGEAVFAWVPNWPRDSISVAVVDRSAWNESRDENQKQRRDGAYQLEVIPSVASRMSERVAVTGQLAGVPAGVSGVLLEFLGDQGGDESTWDGFFARCDRSGRFTVRALPGCVYSAFVNDRDFVSNIWGGVIIASGTGAIQRPELTLSKGVPVEVRVTKGGNEEPLPGAWVSFESSQTGATGPSFWGKTDERGRYVAPVAAGEVKVRVTDGNWSQEKTVRVVEGKPAKIQVHRDLVDKQTITGRLVLPTGVAAELGNTTVRITGSDGESDDTATAKADAQGHFSARILARRASILATSPGEEFFGCGIVDVREEVIQIPMHPTIRYEGHVLRSNDQPLSGVRVRMIARLVDRQRDHVYPRAVPELSRQYVELVRDREAVTDHAGSFVFPKTPQRMELTVFLRRPGETDTEIMTQKYFEPGQARPPETIRIESSEPNNSRPGRPLEPEMRAALRDCRLSRTHALVVVFGVGDLAASFKSDRVWDPEEPNEKIDEEAFNIYSYLPQFIDGPKVAETLENRQYFETQKWPFPEDNSLFLAALDGNGKELGRMTLKLSNSKAAKTDLAAFLKAHLPPRRDAKADYEAALAKAKRSQRRVWVQVGQTRCGACFSFARWLESQRELLEKDYVLFRFDGPRDLHGEELSAALRFDGQGEPCHAILDSDGKELVNSIGPLGNIGNPAGSFEGVQHLRKMLKATARKLSSDDIETLIRSLPTE
jgi:beta-lactamase regulating signal transducer with metallopeptidase domain